MHLYVVDRISSYSIKLHPGFTQTPPGLPRCRPRRARGALTSHRPHLGASCPARLGSVWSLGILATATLLCKVFLTPGRIGIRVAESRTIELFSRNPSQNCRQETLSEHDKPESSHTASPTSNHQLQTNAPSPTTSTIRTTTIAPPLPS